MPKTTPRNKTRKAVAKRFKVTARGKILRTHCGKRHLAECKSSGRKRKLRKAGLVHDTMVDNIKECLPFH